jgi:hypothetical protein
VNSEFEKGENVKVDRERELANRGQSVSGSGECAQNDDFYTTSCLLINFSFLFRSDPSKNSFISFLSPSGSLKSSFISFIFPKWLLLLLRKTILI